MYTPAGNAADFTGVLVRRQWKPGQKYVQLIFRTTEGMKLSITRNIQLVRTLKEGLTYRVKGQEYTVGKKTIIHEPVTTLIEAKRAPRRRLYIGFAAVIVVGGISSALVLTKPTPAANFNQSQSKKTTTQTPSTTELPPASSEQPGPTAENQANISSSSSGSAISQTKRAATPASQTPHSTSAAPQSSSNSSSSGSNSSTDTQSQDNNTGTAENSPADTPQDPQVDQTPDPGGTDPSI
jgi:hypothetical protein